MDPSGRCSDEALVSTARTPGGRAAFEVLVRRHAPILQRYVTRLTGGAADTDDVVQEAFLRAWNQLNRYNPERARFTTWLHRIAHNLAIDLLRKRGRETDLDGADLAPLETSLDPSLDPSEAELHRLRRAIAQLPESQRAALTLRHLQDFSQRETATILDISEAALESLCSRARQTLRATLGGHR